MILHVPQVLNLLMDQYLFLLLSDVLVSLDHIFFLYSFADVSLFASSIKDN